jgi:protein gp37
MADQSKIEWTNATWNPLRGCTRVSEGCRNCYAERVAARFSDVGQPFHGFAERVRGIRNPETKQGTFVNISRWTGEVELVEKQLEDPLRWKKPRRIFVNSMSDLFHEKVQEEWLAKIFKVMVDSPRHTFQILTKRPERMLEVMKGFTEFSTPFRGKPLPNVWLGVSVEDQATADERIPLLNQTPAAVRWVSYEPALGPVDFYGTRIDWLVCGAESGPGARPMDIEWARSAKRQCGYDVPFFMKQICEKGRKIPVMDWPSDLQVREYPEVKA